MALLSDSLLTAAGLFGFGATSAPVSEASAKAEPERRNPSSDGLSSDDPFFLAIAEALQEAGYLDS
ncbi:MULTISPECIES: hypothetical protein [Methylorubrum]|uniref:Uncharacterized protein n=1 Tax=Methylorubrum suomiense TaxID=144191 RepID=A0ABQ4UNT6_9HYPH|nr:MULTISPECIES: hypothetical protein [Methylobacteriaceae]GJE73845.1 hypothetical protein BGCPKDLD_0412 [Methylorubrum suomiense]